MDRHDSRTVDELFDLSGEVAVVTGGPGRLGSQISDALAELGAHVVVVSRTLEDCQEKADQLSDEYSTAIGVEADVTEKEAVERVVDEAVDEFGKVSILINNAYAGESASFEEMTVEQWQSAIDGAMTSTFLCSQVVSEIMKNQQRGSIVNIGSIYGVVAPDQRIYGRTGNNNPINYGAAKAGVIQLTKWLATYLSEWNIRVNAVSPGGFYNHELAEENEYYEKDFASNYRSRTPLGRMGNDTDLKGVIALLASDAGKWITGQNVVVDGGWTAW
jgi:gluconate 5-dehydrogenase